MLALASCGGGDDRKTAAHQSLTSGRLPGGTVIAIGIDTPADGAVIPAAPARIEGTAEIGGAPPTQTALAFAIDASNSTTGPGCGGNQNGDAFTDSLLDCEILALKTINLRNLAVFSVNALGVAAFGAGVEPAQMTPSANEEQVTPPDADLDANNQRDVEQVLNSISPGRIGEFQPRTFLSNATSYGLGITQAGKILDKATGAQRRRIIFIAASENNREPAIDTVIPNLPAGTIVDTIALGSRVSCGAPGTGGFGSLQQIADMTGGTCTNVADDGDFGQLPTIPRAPDTVSRLTAITLTVDGADVPVLGIGPALPQFGKATIAWKTDIDDPGSGAHEICATAAGDDPGGQGSVTECVTVNRNSPPVPPCQDADTVPPVVTVQGGGELWPPNHKYAVVTIADCGVTINDQCQGMIALADAYAEITCVTSDEVDDDGGDGDASNDIALIDATTVNLRSERSGTGDGRVYKIHFRVTDAAGNAGAGVCQVTVPHDRGNGIPAIDSGVGLSVGICN